MMREIGRDGQRPRVEQWTVTDAYNTIGSPKVFESMTAAAAFAFDNARADVATTITMPDGRQVVVMRHDERVSLQAVRRLT